MPPPLLPPQRDLFEIPRDVCYLNFGYMSPLLRAVRRAGEEAVGRKARPWQLTEDHWFGEVERARARFGDLLGSSPDDVALVPSTSYGIGTAAANCPVATGQTIVVLEDQFPSGVYPWRRRALEAGGRLVTVARPPDHDWTPAVLEAIDARTAVACLPACHWTDGSLVDLAAVAERLREVGAQLVLDLAQSLGAAPLDLGRVDPDWVCAPTYKWLLGPYTSGFLYVAPRRQAGVPLEEGWISRAGSEDFSALVDYTDAYRDGARRYDMGERSNFIQLPMVLAGLDQLARWGVDRIAATLRQTTGRIAAIAERHGFHALPEARRAPHILGVTRPEGLPEDLIPRLAQHQVHLSRRGNALRISPHVHVTGEDLERFEEALEQIL